MVPLRSISGPTVALGAACVLAVTGLCSAPAQAQARLEAGYTISVARIPIGGASATIDVAAGEYTIAMTGRASGVMRVLASGEGTLLTRGSLTDGRPVPQSYTSTTTSEDDTLDVKMTFEDGSVKDLAASVPPPSSDRVPLNETHRKDVVDPLTALIVPAGDEGLSEAACRRVLPIFDGRRRYDIKLSFKRMDKVKADKGYAGPVVVCAMTFQPIAGHRASSSLTKFLTEGREMELVLAPIAGTRLLTPFRVTVTHMLGNLVVQANRFEAIAPSPTRASSSDQAK